VTTTKQMYLLCFCNPARLPETWHTHRTFESLEAARECAASLANVRLLTRIYQCRMVESPATLEVMSEARAA
jgi:ferritin-like protein